MQLTSTVASEVFGNIRGSEFNGDATWVATMRALLGERISEDSSVRFRYLRRQSSVYDLSDCEDIYLRQTGGLERNHIVLLSHESSADANEEALKKYDEIMPTHGFVSQADLREYLYRRKISGRVFVNETDRITLIVTAGVMNFPTYHLLQALMVRYLPWFFKDDNKPTEQDKELIRALTSNYSADYEAAIEKAALKFDFRSHQIRTIIGGFERNTLQVRRNALQRDCENLKYEYERAMANYNEFLRQYLEKELMMTGIEAKIASGDTSKELVDFFIANKCLVPIEITNRGFSFVVNTYLTNFDPTAMKKIGENRYSYLYENNPVESFATFEDRKLLLDNLFCRNAKMKLRMCAYFNIEDNGIHTSTGYPFPSESNTYMPNPHLHRHACFGNNLPHINGRLREHDYVGAVIQCIGTAGSVNLTEGASTRPMCQWLFNEYAERPCIELSDGRVLSPVQTLEWIKSQATAVPMNEEEVSDAETV